MQAQLKNIALTIKSATYKYKSAIVIGTPGDPNFQAIPNPFKSDTQYGYWMVILDRSTLKVLENFYFSDNDQVPHQLKPYLNNPDYLYILNTEASYANQLPVGPLYQWLLKEGAGPGLKRLEQTHAALNSGAFAQFSYILVDAMGPASHNSIEQATTGFDASYLALELQPFSINGKIIYSPVEIR